MSLRIAAVGLFTAIPQYMHGPAKVTMNLITGLRKLGIGVRINEEAECNGCLSQISTGIEDLEERTLMGPNIMVSPAEYPELWKKHKMHIVPSEWIREEFKRSPFCEGVDIRVWASGIDTEKFNDNERTMTQDCFIYFKNRTEEDLKVMVSLLESHELTHSVLRYGSYTPGELYALSKRCRFFILMTATESQGIAPMELLAAGLPCFANVKESEREHAPSHMPAYRAFPYLSSESGSASFGAEKSSFESFLHRLDSYQPRKYIVENFSLERAASNYIELLAESHGGKQ